MRPTTTIATLSLVLTVFVLSSCSQTPDARDPHDVDPALRRAIEEHYREWSFYSIAWHGDDSVNYGALIRDGEPGERPLLVFLDGSGYSSVFGLMQEGVWVRPGAPFGFGTSLFEEYDLLMPEKVNVTIGGDHSTDPDVLRSCTLVDRAASSAMVIDAFLERTEYETVYIFGVSEGGVILPRVYSLLDARDRVDKLVVLGAGGLSQAEEFEILGSYVNMPDDLRAGYQELGSVVDEIAAEPESITREWFGHPFIRWSSFLPYSPLDDLVTIDIPILLIHGTEDVSSPVESARRVVEVFESLGKANLTYHEYDGMGHNPGNRREQTQVYTALIEWLGE